MRNVLELIPWKCSEKQICMRLNVVSFAESDSLALVIADRLHKAVYLICASLNIGNCVRLNVFGSRNTVMSLIIIKIAGT